MYTKFTLYYQPKTRVGEEIRSLSISFYDFEPSGNYKKKVVLEKTNGEKYKIKETLTGYNEFLQKINAQLLVITKEECVDTTDNYFYVQYGEHVLETNNKKNVQPLLDTIGFDDIWAQEVHKYQ